MQYDRIMSASIKEDIAKNTIGYTDCKICVDTFYDGYDYLSVFNHEHINPVEIEYARLPKDDLRQGFLEYMKVTICRESAFGPGRSEQRIPAVLEQIRKVWSSYPYMRLGQLILCCSTNNRDLFAMEDEGLMEKLQCIFSKDKSC